MAKIFAETVLSIIQSLEIELGPGESLEAWAKEVVGVINQRFGKAALPLPSESLAISIDSPKTAALAFDRVYGMPAMEDSVPNSISFYCATIPEIVCITNALIISGAQEADIPVPALGNITDKQESERIGLRLMCSEFERILGSAPTILYGSERSHRNDFPKGKQRVLTTTIQNLGLVNESKLTWEQVLEFRQDSVARTKYRRLVRWIDAELATKSPVEIEDAIATNLDDYEWALKKHGVRTAIGALSCLVDPKFLGATSAVATAISLAGGGSWGLLAAATLTLGKSVLSFGEAYIDGVDEHRKTNCEVAYVYELGQRFRK